MMPDLPAPLVPADVDLRGLGYVLRVDKLLASELVALCTPEEGWAAFMLWCRAWQQQPAASLPDNEQILASFSRAGRRWPKVKVMAMRGFVLCSDGRWYHRVLAVEALEAWDRRLTFRERSEKANKAKKNGHQANLEGFLVGDQQGDLEGTHKKGREGEVKKDQLPSAKPQVSPCPHDQIIDLYNEILPMGRQVRKNLWNGTRAKHLQARWREDPERQNLLWWGKFLHHCAKSPFLSGRVPPRRPGEKPFEVSLDWIIDPGNFVKIIEGKYDE